MDGKTRHQQLVDSGADRELAGRKYVLKHGMKIKPLKEPVKLQYMDGSVGARITHATWQKLRFPAANGTRTFKVKYLVADIPEGLVLGFNWLQWANPDIDWPKRSWRWRQPETVLKIRKARQRIIQGEIQHNEPPDWVKRKHPRVLQTRAKGDNELPPHRGNLDYEIRLKPGFKPRREPNRSYSPEERRMFTELAAKEVKAQKWRIGNGPQAVQMLWAAKAGGEKRPCTDYRPLNKWIIDDAFPLPIIRDMMTDITGKRHITSIDLPKAYHQVRCKTRETEDLLSFYCGGALYAPRVMQFGSKTAVAHFQRFITHVLRDQIGRGVHAYLDNVVVFADDQETHDRLLDETLTALDKEQLSVQPRKCEWDKEEVLFCGFLVGLQGVRMDPEKLRAIKEWEPPRNGGPLAKTKVREFTGFCNFYRDGVARYSEICAPLTKLTSPTEPWAWGKEQEASWALLKTAILAAPVRAAYDERLPVEVHTDASDGAIAATVEHRYDCGHTQPIAFYSKKLGKAEQNYTVHDKELLAIVKMFKHFASWVTGTKQKVKIWSDHKALEHFLTTTKLTQRHARWAEILADFNFEICHVRGRENSAADALSRKDLTTESVGGGVRPLSAAQFVRD